MSFLKITAQNRSKIEEKYDEYFPLFDSYFHAVDITRVLAQPSNSEIKGYKIMAATIQTNEGPENAHIAVAVVNAAQNGTATAFLLDPGNVIALSCPPFVDPEGGREIILD